MKEITIQSTIGELVAQYPELMRVFEALSIDYCCGGKQTLAQACATQKLDVETVVTILKATVNSAQTSTSSEQNWAEADLVQLTDHIESTHHQFLHEELPRLSMLVDRVTFVHGERHPELHEVQQVYNDLMADLDSHLRKEEQVLFPAIRRMVEAGNLMGTPSLAPPIQVMMQEHDIAGEFLAKLSQLTNKYTPPADGCNSYKAMLAGLEQVEHDLHRHIAKENNILFPRTLNYKG